MFGKLESVNGLKNLKCLLLKSNDIREIIPGTFENMSSLEHLDLSYNRIKNLSSAMFSVV